MNVNGLVAIDVHTHAEVSCRQPTDAFWRPYEDAADKYFKAGRRPTIAETITYRERKIGLVMFTVDSEFEIRGPAHLERGSRGGRRGQRGHHDGLRLHRSA